MTPKGHFEINWPLGLIPNQLRSQREVCTTHKVYIVCNPALKYQLQFKLLSMKTFVVLLSIFLLVVDGQKKSNEYVSSFFLSSLNNFGHDQSYIYQVL